jgi:hypothetical protein
MNHPPGPKPPRLTLYLESLLVPPGAEVWKSAVHALECTERWGGGAWCNVRDMEGLSASVVLIGILLGVLLVVVLDVFCLLRLGTANTAHFVPRFAWAVLIVGVSPIEGLVYLLAQRLRMRSPEPITTRSRPLLGSKAWYGPALAGEHIHSPASLEGHTVAVVAIAGAAYLAQAGQVLARRRLRSPW